MVAGWIKIVFSTGRHSPDGLVTIYLMNPDGSNLTRLTNNTAYDRHPVFSRTGRKSPFSSERDGGNGEIYVMNANGSGQINITNSVSYDDFPAWSPDGLKLVFNSVLANGTWEEVFSINVNASALTRLTYNNTWDLVYGWRAQTEMFRSPFDFDGDGRTDISIFRPALGEWWYLRSSDAGNRAFQFGNSTDKLTPGDFTGDGKTDLAFFRPSNGEWFVFRSENSTFYSFPFGLNGDIPYLVISTAITKPMRLFSARQTRPGISNARQAAQPSRPLEQTVMLPFRLITTETARRTLPSIVRVSDNGGLTDQRPV
ncbi:MAG: PD40 domain-containing protein [Acidobacteria bacterium]|nr:PD40 domain-containing protein [Acidobacteriota bacterium]